MNKEAHWDFAGHHPTLLTYDPKAVVAALDLLLEAATASPTLLQVAGFQMDLVDAARQAFINLGIPLYENVRGTMPSICRDADPARHADRKSVV